ncbi:MAG: crossover junction endodeoxyribonuclease RuvC [candidate division WOR-3 bacterium]|nr:crossover junction endodeoxyribonuclease RuvC [candidate division WOR-3 bacterium]
MLKSHKSDVVIGLDPGLSATGYGIVRKGECLDYGIIKSDITKPLAERINQIIQMLQKKINQYAPTNCAIETLFFKKESARSVIHSAHLRGALFFLLYKKKIPIVEITPARIKKALTGNGRASKQQIKFMVKNIFHISHELNEHASDALAVAYTFNLLMEEIKIKNYVLKK